MCVEALALCCAKDRPPIPPTTPPTTTTFTLTHPPNTHARKTNQTNPVNEDVSDTRKLLAASTKKYAPPPGACLYLVCFHLPVTISKVRNRERVRKREMESGVLGLK
jgi:hypothetical protein